MHWKLKLSDFQVWVRWSDKNKARQARWNGRTFGRSTGSSIGF